VIKAPDRHTLSSVEQLLDSNHQSGLSDSLTESLHSIANGTLSKQHVAEHRLLEELSVCLSGTSFSVR
jgi:hypothetical protein